MSPRHHFFICYDANMESEFIRSNIVGNRIQAVFLVLAMVCILALIGWLLGGPFGAGIAMVLCVVAIVLGPSVSPHLILRMYHAQAISRQASPHLHDLFSELALRASLPTVPALYYIPSRTLNAFAVGHRSDSAVAITDGLLRMLDAREIAGVLAHEISHIRHRDMMVLGIADTVSRVIASMSQIGQLMLFLAIPTFLMSGSYVFLVVALLLVVSPIISNLLQLALSRSREFNADLGAVTLTRDAEGLASALLKLERISAGTRFPWIGPRRNTETVPALLRSHPPTDERVRRIMEAGKSLSPIPPAYAVQPAYGRGRRQMIPAGARTVRRGPGWHVAGLWY